MIRLILAVLIVGMIFYMVDRQSRSTQLMEMSAQQQQTGESSEQDPGSPQQLPDTKAIYQTELEKARSVETILDQAQQRQSDAIK